VAETHKRRVVSLKVVWFQELRINSDEIQNTPLAADNLLTIFYV